MAYAPPRIHISTGPEMGVEKKGDESPRAVSARHAQRREGQSLKLSVQLRLLGLSREQH